MYRHIVAGGTFDGLHKGHRFFLAKTFESAEKVTIGLTSEAYIKRFKTSASAIGSFVDRKKALEGWLTGEKLIDRATIVPLDNKFGPAYLGDFDAIAVTVDNKDTAIELNQARKERGLPALSLVELPLVAAEDTRPISSTRVRAHEIDRDGHLIMPDSLRPQLQQPLGNVLTGQDIDRSIKRNKDNVIITVGDVTTKTLLDAGVTPSFSIVDTKVERKDYTDAVTHPAFVDIAQTKIRSGPGFIAKAALNAIRLWAASLKQQTIVIDGEEDLLALPVIQLAPIGSVVYYGQPPVAASWACGPVPEGMVEVVVTAEKQQEAKALLEQFIGK